MSSLQLCLDLLPQRAQSQSHTESTEEEAGGRSVLWLCGSYWVEGCASFIVLLGSPSTPDSYRDMVTEQVY